MAETRLEMIERIINASWMFGKGVNIRFCFQVTIFDVSWDIHRKPGRDAFNPLAVNEVIKMGKLGGYGAIALAAKAQSR